MRMKKMMFTPPCTNCKKRTTVGNTNGIPNMVGFQMKDGKTINLCQECLIQLGKLSDADKHEFYAKLGV